MTMRDDIERLEKLLRQKDLYINDLTWRHGYMVAQLAEMSNGVGLKPAWWREGTDWDKAMAHKAAVALGNLASSRYYVIKNRVVSEVFDLVEWGNAFESGERIIQITWLPGDVKVSTVFLGLDHSFRESGNPDLFETMIFGGPNDCYTERYETIEEAEAGHERAVLVAKGSLEEKKAPEVCLGRRGWTR